MRVLGSCLFLILSLLTLGCGGSAPRDELVANPGFESGTDGWRISMTGGTGTLEGAPQRLAGASSWRFDPAGGPGRAALAQTVRVLKDHFYRLSLQAAGTGGRMTLSLSADSDPSRTVWSGQFSLDPRKTFHGPFRWQAAQTEALRLEAVLETSSPASLDEVLLVDLGTAAPELWTAPTGVGSAPWANIPQTEARVERAQQRRKDGTFRDPEDRVRICLFGQSLMNRNNVWATELFPRALAETYGDIFTVENRARGGWSSAALVSCYDQEIPAADPDLVILHDFNNGDGSLEAMLFDGSPDAAKLARWADGLTKFSSTGEYNGYPLTRELYLDNLGAPGIRSMTNTRGAKIEVVLINDHFTGGGSGGTWSDRMAYWPVNYPLWTAVHGMGYVDMRTATARYIEANFGPLSDLKAVRRLLIDDVHLNGEGQYVWANAVLRFFGTAVPFPDR